MIALPVGFMVDIAYYSWMGLSINQQTLLLIHGEMPKLYPFIDNYLNCIPWLKTNLPKL
jgi:hypothetical protein